MTAAQPDQPDRPADPPEVARVDAPVTPDAATPDAVPPDAATPDAVTPAPAAPRTPAPPPARLALDQYDIAVAYDPSKFSRDNEHLACQLIAGLSHLDQALVTAFQQSAKGEDIHLPLRAHAFTALQGFTAYHELLPELAAPARSAKDLFADMLAKGRDPRELLPVEPSHDRAKEVAACWLSVFTPDSFFIPEPTKGETHLTRAVGLAAKMDELTLAWYSAYLKENQQTDPLLFHQLHSALDQTLGHSAQVLAEFCKAPEELRRHDLRMGQTRDEVRARVKIQLDNMLLLGEERIPPQYTVLGTDARGRYVAVSQNTPQFVVAVGRQGTGKSHSSIILTEGTELPVFGLSQMQSQTRTIRFFADWHQGTGRGDQVRAGFFPNRDPEQWSTLSQVFGVERKNYHLQRATLLGHPASVPQLEVQFAALRERGLRICPIQLHPNELGLFGYNVILNSGVEQVRRSAGRKLVESIIAWKGVDVMPADVRKELERCRLDGRIKDPMMMQLAMLEPLVSRDTHLIDHLESGGQVISYIQGLYLTMDQILPLEVAMINALSRPLRSGGDPPRWVHIDEISKHLGNELTGCFLVECTTELRHRPVSYFVSGQRMDNLPGAVAALSTVYLLFGISSPEEFRRGQQLFPALRGLKYDTFRQMKDRHCLVGAVRSNDPQALESGVILATRPSLFYAGGETYTFVPTR